MAAVPSKMRPKDIAAAIGNEVTEVSDQHDGFQTCRPGVAFPGMETHPTPSQRR